MKMKEIGPAQHLEIKKKKKLIMQRRIQDFPEGAPTPKVQKLPNFAFEKRREIFQNKTPDVTY